MSFICFVIIDIFIIFIIITILFIFPISGLAFLILFLYVFLLLEV